LFLCKTKNGIKTFVHYLSAAEAIVVKRDNAAFEYYFPYTDHLGSIVAVTSTSGTIVAEQSFDAWGRKRNPINWTYDNIPSVPTWLYRGYTGHEHLEAFGLINMNARLYDPILGRMLSPDNFAHEGSQGLNRYSYAHNNPLSYVDPDGNNPIIIGAALIGGAVNVFSNWDAIKERGFWSGVSYFGIGAIGGVASLTNPAAATALVAGGNILADVVDPNFKLRENPVSYVGKKALDGLGVSGSGQLARGLASYFWRDAWRGYYTPNGLATWTETDGYVGGAFEKINVKVPTSTAASVASKTVSQTNSVTKQLYEIGDGVRRAKAAEMVGRQTIRAMDNAGRIFEVPIKDLRSPLKEVIDMTNPNEVSRFNKILEGMKLGDDLPPIYVNPGSRGIPVSKITFRYQW
jgi:RHS repeat-associated protein